MAGMTPGNILLEAASGAKGTGKGAGGKDAAADEAFLQELAQGVESLTGKKLDPDALAAWLRGEKTDFAGKDALMSVLDPLMKGSAKLEDLESDLHAEDAPVDVSSLLGILASATKTLNVGKTDGGPAGALLGELKQNGQNAARQMIDGLRAMGTSDDSAAAFQQVMHNASAGADGARPQRVDIPTLNVPTPVGQPGFGQQVGDRVSWMVRNEVQQARIQLNPPGLGPLDVKVSLSDDKASVHITAHHAVTREAMVSDAPKLRMMLSDHGFSAVDVNVSQDQPGQERYAASGNPAGAAFGGDADGDASGEVQAIAGEVRLGAGLVDHYV
jgi:flagellar hook-length control protein FliK